MFVFSFLSSDILSDLFSVSFMADNVVSSPSSLNPISLDTEGNMASVDESKRETGRTGFYGRTCCYLLLLLHTTHTKTLSIFSPSFTTVEMLTCLFLWNGIFPPPCVRLPLLSTTAL